MPTLEEIDAQLAQEQKMVQTKPASVKVPQTTAPAVKPSEPSTRWADRAAAFLAPLADRAAAFLSPLAAGGTIAAEAAIPIVGPFIAGADIGANLISAGAPFAKRMGIDKAGHALGMEGNVSDYMAKTSDYTPSSHSASGWQQITGGDPSKANGLYGAAGATLGLNPAGLSKTIVQQGVKAAAKALGRDASEVAGMHVAATNTGPLAARFLTGIEGNTKEDKEAQESLGDLLAVGGGKAARKLHTSIEGSITKAGGIKESLSGSAAEKRIKELEDSAPIERVTQEHAIAKRLVEKEGMSEEDALKTVKKSSYGAYGDISPLKTKTEDMKIVDSVKQAVTSILPKENIVMGIKKTMDVVNKTVKVFSAMRNILSLRNEVKATPEQVLQAKGNRDTALGNLSESVPNADNVITSEEFKDWSNHEAMSQAPQEVKNNAMGKFMVNKIIKSNWENNVKPFGDDLRATPTYIGKPTELGERVAQGIQKATKDAGVVLDYNGIKEYVANAAAQGKWDTLDGVRNYLQSDEFRSHVQGHDMPEAKDAVMRAAGGEAAVKKNQSFTDAVREHMTKMGPNTLLGKLGTWDSEGSTKHNTVLSLMKDGNPSDAYTSFTNFVAANPNAGYTVLTALQHEVGKAMGSAKTEAEASNAAAKVLSSHIARIDGLSNALPDGHPLKSALRSAQLLLGAAKDHEALAEKASKSEAALNKISIEQNAIDQHVKILSEYGQYAVDSFKSLLGVMNKNPGMFKDVVSSPLGAENTPLVHDVMQSLIVAEGKTPDLDRARSTFHAISLAQGAQQTVVDMVKYGIGRMISHANRDGTVDPVKTVAALRQQGAKVREYVANIGKILQTTPGLDKQNVKDSLAYLTSVHDAIDVADNGLVSKVFERVYGEIPTDKSKGAVQVVVENVPLATGGIRSPAQKAITGVARMLKEIMNSKDSVDTSILKRLDDPDFLNSVSTLKKEYIRSRESDVKELAEGKHVNRVSNSPEGMIESLNKVVNGAMPEFSGGFMGFLNASRRFTGKMARVWFNTHRDASSRAFLQERKNDRYKSQTKPEAPTSNGDEGEFIGKYGE